VQIPLTAVIFVVVGTQSYQLKHESQSIYQFHRNTVGQFFKNTKKWPGFRDINELNRPGFKVLKEYDH
jgi:hypothetical protein